MKKTLKNIILGTCLALAPVLFSSRAYAAQEFIRGDVDGDGKITLTDPVQTLNYLFRGGQKPDCEDAMDVNDDGKVDLGDAVYELRHSFQGGTPPATPFPLKGYDHTRDELDCNGQRDLERIVKISGKDLPYRIEEGGTENEPLLVLLDENGASDHTGLTIAADDVVFDGQNHEIRYGLDGKNDVYGIHIDHGKRVSIKNVRIVEGSSSGVNKYGMYLLWTEGTDISDFEVSTSSIASSAIHIFYGNSHTIRNGKMQTGGDSADVLHTTLSNLDQISDSYLKATGNNAKIFFLSGDGNTLSHVTGESTGEGGDGIELNRANKNTISESTLQSNGNCLVISRSTSNSFFKDDFQSSGINSDCVYFSFSPTDSNTFSDSTFNAQDPGYNDVRFSSFSSGTSDFTHVELANKKISFDPFPDSQKMPQARFFWYVNAEIKDKDQHPIEHVNVQAHYQNPNEPSPLFSVYSDIEGRIQQQTLLGSVHDANGVEYSSYDFTASHPDYNNPATFHLDEIDGNIDWKATLRN